MKAIALLCLGALLASRTSAQTAPAAAHAARQLLAEARALFDSSRFEEGGARAERAFSFLRNTPDADPGDLAEAAYQAGRGFYRKTQYGEAQQRFEIAANIWAKVQPGAAQTADAIHNVARCLYWQDKPDSALMVCQRAYHIRQGMRPPSPCDLAESERYMGNICIELGRYATAIKHYESALPLQTSCSGAESDGVADVLGNLGYAWSLQGNLRKSIAIQEQTLGLRQKLLPPDHLDIAYSCHNLGFAYKTLLKYQESLPYFEKALSIRLKKHGETHLEVANSYSEIGRAYIGLRDFQKALANFEKANDIMIQLKATEKLAYSYVCANMGQVNIGLKNYAAAVEWHEKTVAFRRKATQNTNSPLASALVQLGYAKLAKGDFESALADFKEAKSIWEVLFGPQNSTAARADAGLANTYRNWHLQTGQDSLLEKARHHFRLAENGVDESVRAEPNLDMQRKVLSEAVPVFERAINAEITFLKSKPGNLAALEKSWQLSEAMHGYLLFSSTQEANARHFAGIPDHELSRDSLLRANIASLEKKRRSLIETQGLSITDSLVLASGVQIAEKKEEVQQLQAYFEKHYPEYFRLKYQLQNSSLEKTRQGLGPQQTLLEYFTGDSAVFVFVVQRDSARVFELPRDFPLAAWVQDIREGLSAYHTSAKKSAALYEKTVRQYAGAAQKLYEKLLAPIAGILTPELIVVPGDGLANLPFEALLSAAPKDLSNFGTYPFLLRSHSFQYAYSATMLHQMTARQHRQAPPGTLLAFAPFFEEDTANLAMRLLRDDAMRFGFSPLPFSGEEVLRAKKRCGGTSTVFAGPEATKQKFLALAPRYKILHLATHGKANRAAGDFSFLAFQSADGNEENGLLSVGELYNISLNTDLVLLSACETGIGEQQRGEGVLSLARAFAFAGAKSIVASLWSVNDQSTMQVMDYFYAGLKLGKPKNRALSDAKLLYLEKNPAQKAHPFFWAGFVGVGDPSAVKN